MESASTWRGVLSIGARSRRTLFTESRRCDFFNPNVSESEGFDTADSDLRTDVFQVGFGAGAVAGACLPRLVGKAVTNEEDDAEPWWQLLVNKFAIPRRPASPYMQTMLPAGGLRSGPLADNMPRAAGAAKPDGLHHLLASTPQKATSITGQPIRERVFVRTALPAATMQHDREGIFSALSRKAHAAKLPPLAVLPWSLPSPQPTRKSTAPQLQSTCKTVDGRQRDQPVVTATPAIARESKSMPNAAVVPAILPGPLAEAVLALQRLDMHGEATRILEEHAQSQRGETDRQIRGSDNARQRRTAAPADRSPDDAIPGLDRALRQFESALQGAVPKADPVAATARALYNMGVSYKTGRVGTCDLHKAAECYASAASLGHAKAMYNLGVFHTSGQGGVDKDWAAAARLFEGAAEQGFAHAQRNVGLCYAYGLGRPMDRPKAIWWLEQAVAQGDPKARVELERLNVESPPTAKADSPTPSPI